MKGFLFGIIITLLVLFGIVMFVAKTGRVNFSADQQPSDTEKHLAMSAVDASTDRHAPDVKNPLQPNETTLVAGADLYMNHCAGCHGLPSNPESAFAKSFNPPVPMFFKEAPDMAENQNFYIIQHGIRWSGMPAWNSSLNDTQMWQLVTFLSNVEKLPPAAQKKLEVLPAPTIP
ncbi:MAG TPA: c-type cytochrome [Candidatus Acidoferrales bacterium]